MTKKKASFRSTLGSVRALGSAKSGTHHWILQRFTAIALLLLALYPVVGLFIYAVYGGRAGAVEWVHSPFTAAGLILFLIVAFHHAAAGLQVVIEDYVHSTVAKTALLLLVKFAAVAFAVVGILAVLKISLGV